ncbi:MAG: MaoC/PaaZ C-terminal domain-containing protein [Sedimentisphaerales bacterium]|jgi:hydroxyacyl-ACP dehydratase HTD2-like protein with hotdog domain
MRQVKLCWENLSVTSRIPELTVCPDHAQIFMFSAITWNRHHIHYSKDAAVSEGLPDIVVQRALIGNFLARLITNWTGDSAELRKLAWKVTRSALPGRDIVCRGKIKERIDSEDEKRLVCEVTASDENDNLIASGDATIVFPLNHTPN